MLEVVEIAHLAQEDVHNDISIVHGHPLRIAQAVDGGGMYVQVAAQLIVNHIEDYGFMRYEMGYAAAVSVVLLLIIQLFSKGANALLTEKD